MKKILLINFITTILVILFFELLTYFILINRYSYEYKDNPRVFFNCMLPWSKVEPFDEKNYDNYENKFRKPIIIKNCQNPIVLFCCSMAYSAGLEENDTFAFLLSKYTNRSVYIRAKEGAGPQLMLFQLLEDKNFIKKVPKCKTFIYIFIEDHPMRLIKVRNWPFLSQAFFLYFPLSNDNFKKINLSKTILYSNIYRYLEDNIEENIKNTHLYNLFFQVVSKSFQVSQKLYPDSDFIIINYSYKPLPKNNELKKLGIKIIDIKDITSENLMSEKYYVSNEDRHPNKKAWQLIAQYLIKNKYISQE